MSLKIKCCECENLTGSDEYIFCKTCFRNLRSNKKIIECEDCGTWHYSNAPCVCEIPFVQCSSCGRWYYFEDICFCKLEKNQKDDKQIYQKKKSLLSDAELIFKNKLEQIVDFGKYDILYQTSLRQLVEKTIKWQWANELNRDIDFCIALKDTTPILLIEYDDTTHERPERKERDMKVERILIEVGIKLVRIPRNDDMSVDYLRGKLEDYLKI